ncbi:MULTISPECIES: AMP-binding protein [Methylotenera]|uniref:AMP-binding protein n=1 Tax=Methylotenera TaxID=359407 RepID=UPI0003822BF4|nr:MULTISPECIES: AMP-binding protein [Methylotenera]
MQNHPLITHKSLDSTIAWRNGAAISVEKFLTDVDSLATLLPAGKYILNVCRDRYHFTVGLAAAIISSKISVLPPTHTPEMLRQLQIFAPDVFCLHDNPDCDIALPRISYPIMPECAVKQSAKKLAIPQINAQQLIAIVFTSGSTGAPIPHQKTWGGLVRNVQAQAARLGLTADADYSIVGTIPPQHMYGFESTILLPLQTGNALSCAQPFYPADITDALASIPAPRMLVSTPLHLRLLLDAELNLPELALTLSATAPLSTALAHKIEDTLKTPLIEIYGSTETGQIATRRTTHSGAWQLLPKINLTQRDEQTWAEGGHIECATALNDVIELTDTEHFLLHGRTQDLINIAGKRSSLANLNHHLNNIEGVIDGAFFMPDEHSHDHVTRLSACVVAPGLTASKLLAALRSKIDPVFLPRPLLFVECLPRNATGKLPREALKKLFAVSVNKDLNNKNFSDAQI